ncbi:alpha-D-ribose 1-methylphosphonate 5-phosphate C-P-lyase PhnJ [Collinsella vaginalis]|uniref:alpha-D-ribose 1-methylphosphonate 5-phosphate C-P-lyase PhnJ n=1 Tax=Collinsella vaginalis TaxID=1870987 RepID=UPI000A26F1A0|nr:alpha-D-ribose 1-methylphosphonate 5-phosphate C-P-lyase PhnJ [Collinsella vaginalis]
MRRMYNFAYLDEGSKREIRRAILKGVAIPGYQVPFASREMPIGRGWGTGGLQITLACIGPDDVLKVIDQGSDASVNAVSIRDLVHETTGVELTERTQEATLIQSRHRIPERTLTRDQLMVLQVPMPEPLRTYEPRETVTRRLHAEAEYTGAYLELFEQIVRYGTATTGADHPVMVGDRYVMAPSPIPRYDNPRLNDADNLFLLGAGREKKIYAVPPHTKVESLAFDDFPFAREDFDGAHCCRCGGTGAHMTQTTLPDGTVAWQCSDTDWCDQRLASAAEAGAAEAPAADGEALKGGALR